MRGSAITISILAIAALSKSANAAEVCGNAVDDDANGLVDEKCYPTLTTGQCDNPLTCAETGMVSPLTGSLRYQLPPDVAPSVPFGPGIQFTRFYVSQYAPGGSAPAYRKALGERWHHSYASWLDKYTTPSPDEIVLHLPRGQDAMFKFTGTVGGFDEYNTFQPGFRFQYLKQRVASPNEYELKTLTGERLIYNSSGKLIEIHDSLATANKVLLTYDGNGMLSTVTDANNKRRLLFSYTSSVITSIAFQLNDSGWTTQHTTSYSYTNGNLTGVTIGSQSAQTNVYTSSYLTSIQDGAGNTLVNFVYDSATAGKVVRVDTPRGLVGYEFASSRSNCSGKTVLYFHRQNTTSCSVDSDCGTGYLCGGKTGSGSTGQCFRGARCLTVSSPSEDVVTTVSAFAGNSETCDGACLDAIDHVWDTASSRLDLTAVKDPSNYFTVTEFETTGASKGLPKKIIYGASDSSGTGGQRTVFITYDSNFPGRVAETRRQTEAALNQTGGTCSPSTSTECQRTLHTYTTDGKLATVRQIGHTLNASAGIITYDFTTTNTYDTKGRLTLIDGPLSGTFDSTVLEYWSDASPLKDGFLQNFKRQIGPSGAPSPTYLTQPSLSFDFWGNAIVLKDADLTISCQTFDSARGFLSQRREQMNGQTDCTTHSSDLVTSYERDSALRLTKVTRPDGSCIHYEYDTRGRLSKTKRRDDCTAASSGEKEEYTYSDDGLLTKIETFDSSSVVTKRQELTYLDSRRIEKIINPVDTSKWTGLIYEARGLLSEIAAKDGSSDLSKTTWVYNADGRVTDEKRFTAGTSFDTWALIFDWLGNQEKVTDGDSKVTESVRDDLGRVVKLINPDLGGYPTLRVYNDASQLLTIKERFNVDGEQIHNFTYDPVNRPLDANYHGGQCVTFDVADIVRAHDCLGTGGGCTSGAPACPSGTSCTNLAGRLAYVKVKLMCTSAAGPDNDYTLEQETWFGYDAAGRVTHEYIKDDSDATNPRTAAHVYEWTKNGALSKVTLPSTAVLGATFGSTGSNSDTDRITALWRTNTSTPIIDNLLWEPYGPFKQYNQFNSSSLTALRTVVTRNLAYRITNIKVEKQTGGSLHEVALSEDAKGRVTFRNYYPNTPTGRYDSHFIYDLQDRVLCENTDSSGTCPTSGSNLKNNHSASPPFTAAGDWKTLLRPIPGSTGVTHAFALTSGTHQIATVTQSDGTPTFGATTFTHNTLGNRSSDDNSASSSLSHDTRDYTYDARRNVVNVHGEYYTGTAWHEYDVASAFDAKNRRVFKSFYDNTTTKLATWFFYYDALDRLVEIRHTPDTSASSTYSLFQLVWLGDRLVLYWQTDYPSVTTSKRYVATDETTRPIDMTCWGTGNCPRVWTVNPDAWGNDTVLTGSDVFQPILFAGQYKDDETIAWQNDGTTRHRPGVVLNGYRTYDPWTGSYLQVDPLVDSTWSTYIYVNSDPVGKSDPDGRRITVTLTVSAGFPVSGTFCWRDGSWGIEVDAGCLWGFDDDEWRFGGTQSVPCPLPYHPCDLSPNCTRCKDGCNVIFDLEVCACIRNGEGDPSFCATNEQFARKACMERCKDMGQCHFVDDETQQNRPAPSTEECNKVTGNPFPFGQLSLTQ